MTHPAFDLTVEPWLPVVGPESTRLVSLREALTGAHEIDALDHANPLVAAALHRMLTAVAVDLLPPLRSRRHWQDAFDEGRFDAESVGRYLDKDADRLDLFHPRTPFMQVAGLEAVSGEWKSVSLLLPEVATGNNVPLFSAVNESSVPPLTPAQAAQRLVSTHAWDTAAIKTGAKGDPKVSGGITTGNHTGTAGSLGLVIPLGRNLFETLLLSCLVGTTGPQDQPAWRQPPATAEWTTRVPRGIRDLLTWQSRRIRLLPEVDERGITVAKVVVTAGDRMELLPPDLEPHTMWRAVDAAKSGVPQRPVRHQPGRAAWRGMAPMVATRAQHEGLSSTGALTQLGGMDEIPDDYPLGVLTVGVAYGNQSAVIEDVMTDSLPLPVRALRGDSAMRVDLEDAVTAAEGCKVALNKLADNLRRAAGGDPTPWDKGQRPGDRLIAGLNGPAQELLRDAQRSPERMTEHLVRWGRMLRERTWSIADPLLDDAPAGTFLGRAEDREGKRFIRQANAEAFFRAAVRKALPRAYLDLLPQPQEA